MGTLNDILAFMYKMDKGYEKSVNLNENSVVHLLIEDKRQNQARNHTKHIIAQIFEDDGITAQQIDEKLREIEDKFYHDPKMRSSAVMRLEPLICRIAIEECGFGTDFADNDAVQRLVNIVDFLYDNRQEINFEKTIPTECLYNWTFEDLEDKFGGLMDLRGNEEYKTINSTEYPQNWYEQENEKYTPNGYKIVGPLSYEEANKIGNKSCVPGEGGELCYTQSIQTWNKYTMNGINTAYAALKEGWDNTTLYPAVHNKNFVSPYDKTQRPTDESPYDKYGLSMIFVFVNSKCDLTTCNTRWNHRADYNGLQCDHALNRTQVSEIIGANFFNVFKWDDSNSKNGSFGEIAVSALEHFNKNDGQNLFHRIWQLDDSAYLVELNSLYNVIKNGQYKYKKWFDAAFNLRGWNLDLYEVAIGDKYNLLKFDGNLVYNRPYYFWFDYTNFCDWYVKVVYNNKKNIVTSGGEFIWKHPIKEWFDGVYYAAECRCFIVKKQGKENILSYQGVLMSEQWFDCIFEDAKTNGSDNNYFYVAVLNGSLYKLYPEKQKIVKPRHIGPLFDDISPRSKNNFYLVQIGEKFNFISRKTSRFLSNTWFDEASEFDGGLASVSWRDEDDNQCFNWIRPDGRFFTNEKITTIDDRLCDEGFAIFGNIDDKFNVILRNGKLLFNKYYEDIRYVEEMQNGEYVFFVSENGLYNIFSNKRGFAWKKPESEWFNPFPVIIRPIKYSHSDVFYDENLSFWIHNTEGYNVINLDGKIAFEYWFDNIEQMYLFWKVKCQGKYNLVNTACNKLLWDRPIEEWFDTVTVNRSEAQVSLNGKVNYINPYGQLVWDKEPSEWFDVMIGPFNGNFTFERGEYLCANQNDEFIYYVKDNQIIGKQERNK